VGFTPTGSYAYRGHLGKLFEGVKAELIALGSILAAIVILDQREYPWFQRQEFVDNQSGSSLMDSGMFCDVFVGRETPAILIGTMSEHPEDNLLSGFQRGDLEN
jgi:hypothetical protein